MLDEITEVVGTLSAPSFLRSGAVLKKLAARVEQVNALEKETARLSDKQCARRRAVRQEIARLRARTPTADKNLRIERYLE